MLQCFHSNRSSLQQSPFVISVLQIVGIDCRPSVPQFSGDTFEKPFNSFCTERSWKTDLVDEATAARFSHRIPLEPSANQLKQRLPQPKTAIRQPYKRRYIIHARPVPIATLPVHFLLRRDLQKRLWVFGDLFCVRRSFWPRFTPISLSFATAHAVGSAVVSRSSKGWLVGRRLMAYGQGECCFM